MYPCMHQLTSPNEYLCIDFTKLLNFIPIPAWTKESSQLSLSILLFIGFSLLAIAS